MTVKRRQVLGAGAALATSALAGCGASPQPAITASGQPPLEGARGAAEPGAPAPAPPPSAGGDGSAPMPDGGPQPAPQAPAAAPAPKVAIERVVARLGKNHGHVITVALADVLAGVEKTYELGGTASHPHALTLSADQMIALRTAEVLRTRTTENSGHSHRVWVRCGPAVDPPEWVTACKATFTGKDEHEVVVPEVDLAATTERTYDVQGIAGHTHQLTLTPADFETLRKGGPVTRHTSRLPEDAHMHQVTVERLARKG